MLSSPSSVVSKLDRTSRFILFGKIRTCLYLGKIVCSINLIQDTTVKWFEYVQKMIKRYNKTKLSFNTGVFITPSFMTPPPPCTLYFNHL